MKGVEKFLVITCDGPCDKALKASQAALTVGAHFARVAPGKHRRVIFPTYVIPARAKSVCAGERVRQKSQHTSRALER
jgi:hypothetical protein